MAPHYRSSKCDDPDAEDSFNLTEGVKEPCPKGDIILGVILRFVHCPSFFLLDDLTVPVLVGVGHFRKHSGEKGMENGAGENYSGYQVEVILGDGSFPQLIPEGALLSLEGRVLRVGVCWQWEREMSVLFLAEIPFAALGVGGFLAAGSCSAPDSTQ